MDLYKKLEKYGLTPREIKVLTNLYSVTDTTSFRISKETGIPKTTVYDILDNLKRMRLVNSWKKNNITYYYSENPNQLIKTLEERIDIAQQIVPELKMLGKNEEKPTSRMYEGVEGVRLVMDDLLETAREQKVGHIEAVFSTELGLFFPEKYTREWVKDRDKAKIHIRIIMPKSDNKITYGYNSEGMRETRILSSKFPIKGSFTISGSKIAFFSAKNDEMYSVLINSDTFSEMIRQLFYFTWEKLDRKF